MSKKKRLKRRGASNEQSLRPGKVKTERSRRRVIAAIATVTVIVIAIVVLLGLHSSTVTSGIESSVANQVSKSASDNSQSSNAVTGGPSIHFPEPSFDFGTISQGDKVSHTFVVQNNGDEPLKLIKAKGS